MHDVIRPYKTQVNLYQTPLDFTTDFEGSNKQVGGKYGF